jgi:hypothetical protein
MNIKQLTDEQLAETAAVLQRKVDRGRHTGADVEILRVVTAQQLEREARV